MFTPPKKIIFSILKCVKRPFQCFWKKGGFKKHTTFACPSAHAQTALPVLLIFNGKWLRFFSKALALGTKTSFHLRSPPPGSPRNVWMWWAPGSRLTARGAKIKLKN